VFGSREPCVAVTDLPGTGIEGELKSQDYFQKIRLRKKSLEKKSSYYLSKNDWNI